MPGWANKSCSLTMRIMSRGQVSWGIPPHSTAEKCSAARSSSTHTPVSTARASSAASFASPSAFSASLFASPAVRTSSSRDFSLTTNTAPYMRITSAPSGTNSARASNADSRDLDVTSAAAPVHFFAAVRMGSSAFSHVASRRSDSSVVSIASFDAAVRSAACFLASPTTVSARWAAAAALAAASVAASTPRFFDLARSTAFSARSFASDASRAEETTAATADWEAVSRPSAPA
ncbi:unnamed protein product, partial [Trypanosoma congolense IL3000]